MPTWIGLCKRVVLFGSHQYPVFMHIISLCTESVDHVGDGSGQVGQEAHIECMRGRAVVRHWFLFSEGKPFKCSLCFTSHCPWHGGKALVSDFHWNNLRYMLDWLQFNETAQLLVYLILDR